MKLQVDFREVDSVIQLNFNENKSAVNVNFGQIFQVGSTISDLDQLALLVETDMLPAVHNESGAILTDSAGNVVLRY